MLITGLCRSRLLPYVALAQRLENASCTGQRSEQPSRPDRGLFLTSASTDTWLPHWPTIGAWPPGYRRGRFPVDQVSPPALVDPVSTERFGDGSRYIGPRSQPGGTGDHVILAAHRVIDGDGHTKRRSFAPVTGLHRSNYQGPPGLRVLLGGSWPSSVGSAQIVKHHLPAPRHAGTRSGSRTYHTSSLLGIHVMNRPVTSQYRWRGVCWRRVSVAVYRRSVACRSRDRRRLEARREQS
jgi:hypothetical protein